MVQSSYFSATCTCIDIDLEKNFRFKALDLHEATIKAKQKMHQWLISKGYAYGEMPEYTHTIT